MNTSTTGGKSESGNEIDPPIAEKVVADNSPIEIRTHSREASAKTSYSEILKSSFLIGGSSVIVALFGVVRAKVVAVILGPAGFGLMGIYSSIVDVGVSVAGFGVGGSGVREVANAAASGNEARLRVCASAVRQLSLLLGVIGALGVILTARPLAKFALNDASYSGAVALLSLAVLFRVWTAGYGALLQGLRRLVELAVFNAFGALLGVSATIVLVYLYRENGVAPALIASTLVGLIIAWWFNRGTGLANQRLSLRTLYLESIPLLRLGMAFMVSGFLMMGSSLAVRAIVLRFDGLEAAGFYQAAWTVGGLYVGLLLQGMSADFFPRLSAAAKNDTLTNQNVNEQAEVSLLLAGPGIIGTVAFAPFLMTVFYSQEFTEAVGMMRWICLGMALKVLSWPLGFVLVARSRQGLFVAIEALWAFANVWLSYVLVSRFGLDGAGMAFLGAQIVQIAAIYPVVRRLSGYKFSSECYRIARWYLCLMLAVFFSFVALGARGGLFISAALLMFSVFYSVRHVSRLVSVDQIPTPLLGLLVRLRIIPDPVSRK